MTAFFAQREEINQITMSQAPFFFIKGENRLANLKAKRENSCHLAGRGVSVTLCMVSDQKVVML